MASETTAAAGGQMGKLLFDPMAMIPFCGYNMADYFKHRLNVGTKTGQQIQQRMSFLERFVTKYFENSYCLK
jgi:phosphoenolpyruvate carboxykinase (GTP)